MGKKEANKPVVTGQQIGLLGGPLYTTYKVLGAVKLARKIKSSAVYWLETNDADFNEINHIEYIDAAGKLSKLTWDINSRGYSVGYIAVDKQLISLLGHFFDSLRQTEFTPELKKMALEAYSTGKTLAQASADLARSLFGRFKINIFDPRDRHFLKSSRELLVEEAERTREGEQCNLFCVINKKRVAIFKDKSGFRDRNGHPVDIGGFDLVPNVKTRNLIQDQFFDTHTYVAGPSEVEYIHDLDEMYLFHRVSKPDIQKRMSVVLIEPRILRILKKTDIDLSDILGSDREDFLKKTLKGLSGFDHPKVSGASEKLIQDFLAALEKLGLDIQPLKGSLERTIREAIGKQRARSKESIAATLNRIQSLFDHLKPYGFKQERVFNLFYFLNLYGGVDFIGWLYDHYDAGLDILEITT
jgi:uncharacterized protein YllA (UPF0747 family)